MKKRPSTFFQVFRRASKRLKAMLVVILSFATGSAGLLAQGPAGGTVRAGDVRITGQGTSTTRIDQSSDRAIIDWRSFGIGAGDQVIFQQPSVQSATLNRVTGEQVSVILGKLDANGTVLLINPNGVVFGGGAQINVGSLIASTSNLSDANFMSGKLVFDQPGRPGAGILNAGTMTAKEGGLVALVAPHVRNDGIIMARLGKVVLGAADTFTVDLYGDALINLALSNANAGQLVGLNGEPVTSLITNTGHIETAGGQTVLMTARNAKNVLDSLVNMTGTIKADTAVQQGGRILLLGEGGTVDVSGSLSAQGTTGGSIQVLGDRVHLGGTAALDASGLAGGGSVQVGGAYQGRGETHRSVQTTVDAGATMRANAIEQGNGGEAVVWSDGHTDFAGTVEAKGGAASGNGGRLEVSGKGTLGFLGQADASTTTGTAGSLLLDPEYLSIGATEAGAIMRVLRTGTTTNLQADVDVNVDSPILGGDRAAGGGLNITAGHNININEFIVTHAGAINLNATSGTVTVAPGKAVFAGTAPITVTANGDLHTGAMVTGGSLAIQSLAGNVAIDAYIDEHTGPVSIRAAGTVDINQPIVSMASGNVLTVTAGSDVNVNAQVDGRGDVEGGAITMTANRDLNVNQAIITNNGQLTLTANGAMNTAAAPLVTGTGALSLNARGNIATGAMSAGALNIASSAGSVSVNGVIDTATGNASINAASDVTLAEAIVNGQSGASLNVTAGRDVNVTGMIDGRGGVAGGAVNLNATRNVNVSEYILTNDGAVNFTAANGTVAAGKGTFAGKGAIAMRSAGDLTTGIISGGSLTATSAGGSVTTNGVLDAATGRVDLTAARDVTINAPVANVRTGAAFNATAGRDVVLNAIIDGREGASKGAVALKAGRDVDLNNSIVTNSGDIGITAAAGSITMAKDTALVSGRGAIAITAHDEVTTYGISGGSLAATAQYGSVNVNGLIDGNTGRVDLSAAHDVNINAPVLNTRTGASLNARAGGNINVNAQIDGTHGLTGGAVNLTASGDLNVNAPIATQNGEIRLSATNGNATVVPTAGLFAGSGAISLDALGTVTTGTLNGGLMNIASRGGSVFVSGQIVGTGGAMTIGAAGQVDIAHAITNLGTSSPLSITAGSDIKVNAPVGTSAVGIPSSAVTLSAGQNVRLNDSIQTQDGAISVSATNGTVSTAETKGLFAGAAPITVQSGETLNTGTFVTTGALTLRSTAGDVNVNKAIAGTTGAVTISAGNDVNVNQSIANPRADATLIVSAGHDINVNAKIDGRTAAPTGPSGGVMLTAGNNVTLNQSIVSNDNAIIVTATNGSVTGAPTEGLYAGRGDIAVTSGATLNTGITSTTGSLFLTSTRGDVNVNTAIADTVGTVAINAGTTVNINQAITNLKTGSDLFVTAGTDINVLAQVDGRSGTTAGGKVTMTAGNNVSVVSPIATNNGAISLTATTGSVTLPVGAEVIGLVNDPILGPLLEITTPMQASVLAGNADVTITSGSDFTLTSPISTTGALTLISTNGDVTTAAPIDDRTGKVVISAGDALVVNREIRTNDKEITLIAGAGGILINPIDDHDYSGTSSVNSRGADLTLSSVGNVTILDGDGVATLGTLTIDTRGQIVAGVIGDASTTVYGRPASVVLNADAGIAAFTTGKAGSVTATSSGGSIALNVDDLTSQLKVTTGTPNTTDCPTCNISIVSTAFNGSLGPSVVLNAGGSIDISAFMTTDADFTARSGDINLNGESKIANAFTGTAGRDIKLSGMLWLGNSPGTPGGGPLTLTAGRDVITTANSPIHVSNGAATTLGANRHMTLFVLETLGSVALTANTGNITLNRDIGGHIVNTTTQAAFNPGDLGVASFTMSAPSATAAINMKGLRAQGNVTISTGGTLTATKEITSVFGTVSIFAGGGYTPCISSCAIGNVDQLIYLLPLSPISPPGPRAPNTGAPGFAGNGAAGPPAFAEIAVSAGDQIVGGVGLPGVANGGVGVGLTAGGSNAPNPTGGANRRPGSTSGSDVAQPGGGAASDGVLLDPASALRAAGEKCGEDGASGTDTGLDAVAPKKNANEAGGQAKGSCETKPKQ